MNSTKISVIIPSRDRANELLTAIKSLGMPKNQMEALVWLDKDDPQLKKYKEIFKSYTNVKLFIKERVGYKNSLEMLNFLCKQAKYDWIFQFNDDAYMNNPQWFDIFKNFVSEFEPANQPVVINIWGQGDLKFNLFPIVSRKFIEILGHYSTICLCDSYVQGVALGANIHYSLKGIKPKHRKYGEENPLIDETFKEVEKDRNVLKWTDLRRTPYRQMIRKDAQKIIDYNMSKEAVQNLNRIKTVGFIGLGKLGLPIAGAIAERGFNILGYDIRKVETTLPLAKSIRDLVKKSDIVFCAVQTPHDPKFGGDSPLPKKRADFDYSYLIEVVKKVAAVNKKIDLVVISTCLPGTYITKIKPHLADKINYIYNPFSIAMGTVVQDFLNPEFVLIGGEDTATIKYFYTKFYGHDRTFITDITTAEGIKMFYNTYITTKIVLGNMYGEFSHKLGMNVDHIYEALSRATYRIISPKYLKSGMADGGSCHPRDNIALSFLADKLGMSFNYFDWTLEAREKHTQWLADLFIEEIAKNKIPGIILGKSFKPETQLQTGSPAILLANILKGKKIDFSHYEFDYPELTKAVYFIATKHQVYTTISFPSGSVIIDPFRYINPQSGVKIIGIGRP